MSATAYHALGTFVVRTVWMEDWSLKLHLRGHQRIIGRKRELGSEKAAYSHPCPLVKDDAFLEAWYPLVARLTSVMPALVRNHKHDLPLKDVTVDESAADSRYVLVGLHLFELTAE